MEAVQSGSSVHYRAYQAGSRIAPHAHASASLTLLLAGEYEERIGGRAAEHRADSLLICPADVAHAQVFGRLGARKIIVTPGEGLLDYLQTTTPFASAPVARSTLIGKLARQIDAERRLGDGFSDAAIEGVLWQLAATMGRDLAGSSRSDARVTKRARRVLLETEDEILSIAALSREADCHPATLTRAFQREYGSSPGRYQRQLRIDRAARLLRDTAMPLAEVASACGFYDQSHLARSFRASLGCTPSEYRRRA